MNRTYENPFADQADDEQTLRKLKGILEAARPEVEDCGRRLCTAIDDAAYTLWVGDHDEWRGWHETASILRYHIMSELTAFDCDYFGEWFTMEIRKREVKAGPEPFHWGDYAPNQLLIAGRLAWLDRMVADLDDLLAAYLPPPPALIHVALGAPGMESEKRELADTIQHEIVEAKRFQAETGCSWTTALKLAKEGGDVPGV